MPLLAGVRVGHREDDRDVGVLAAGDELLGAVQHPAVAVAARPRLDRGGVGAGLRLGQAEARRASRRAPAAPESAASAPREPYCRTGMQPTELCTLTIVEVAPSPAAISSIASA